MPLLLSDLIPTPDNPIPSGAERRAVTTRDGIDLRAFSWRTLRKRSRGTVCLLQGRAEFIEKYFETIGELRERGFHVLAFDWRGQGGSQRQVPHPKRGYVDSFHAYCRDLEAIQNQALTQLPAPHFALAHSMGASIALLASTEEFLPFERLVATAPMIDLSLIENVPLARAASRVLGWLGRGKSYVPGGSETSLSTRPFENNRLTSDQARYRRNAAAAAALGNGAIGDPTIGWLNAAFHVMARFQEPRFALSVGTPTLILASSQDRIVSTPAIERFSARMKTGKAIVISGARHEILMETDAIRAEFWAAFDAFIPGNREAELAPLRRIEEFQGGRVQLFVSGGDNGAASGG